jgi:hypothetical protein
MRRKTIKTAIITVSAVLALTACSYRPGDKESLGGLLLSTVTDTARSVTGRKQAPTPNTDAARAALLRIAKTGRPGLLVSVPNLGQTTVMILEQDNDGYQTFRGTNNTSVTLKSGIVTATRGMGIDLMAQALGQPETGLFTSGSFPKEYARVQRHLDGENHLLSAEYLCVAERKDRETITIIDKKYATTVFEETCRNDRRSFLNRYWVGAGTGTIWQSQQSISHISGYVVAQRIAGR